MKLTEQEYNCCAMGKFQNVTLFGIAVEPPDLTVTCYHVEPISRDDHVNMIEEKLANVREGAKK